MKRREFLRGAGAGMLGGMSLALGACAVATQPNTPPTNAPAADAPTSAPATDGQAQAPAQPPAQSNPMPALDWQMATSWPVALDTIFGGAQTVADRVSAITEGKFKITPRAAGELAPGTQVLDVVSQGAVEIGHTASYYYIGKSPITAFGTALPFGLNAQQQNAWLYDGGGLAKLQELYAKLFNVIQWPAGNTGVQMGGWFRKEINTIADLQGLKMRIPGLGGQVMAKLGVTVQVLAGGEIFQALQTGAIDAAEWVGPYDDEKLGLNKAAQFYYYPGWWEPGPSLEVQINLDKWNELPKVYQEALKASSAEANITMLARYDARNRAALKSLVDGGAQLRPYSPEILAAAEAEAFKLNDEFAAKDADFKSVYDPWLEFRTGIHEWNKINEFSIASHLYNR
jgi:TRAP-type mannitol/chloroaromatic compound transport system substrate-binding protein